MFNLVTYASDLLVVKAFWSRLHHALHKSTDFGVRVCSSCASEELCSWIQMIHSLWMKLSALEATLATRPALRALQTSHKEAVSNHWCTWKQLAAKQTAERGEEREWDQTKSMWELYRAKERVLKKKRCDMMISGVNTVRKANRNRLHSLTGKECSQGNHIL